MAKLTLSLMLASIIAVIIFVIVFFASGLKFEEGITITILTFIGTFVITYLGMWYAEHYGKVKHEKELLETETTYEISGL